MITPLFADLRRAITDLLSDPAPAATARRVADEIATLPPPDEAVAVITGAAAVTGGRDQHSDAGM